MDKYSSISKDFNLNIHCKQVFFFYLPLNSTRPMRFDLGFGKRNSITRTVNDIIKACRILHTNLCAIKLV